jgi:DNA-binding NtrC family response regulator
VPKKATSLSTNILIIDDDQLVRDFAVHTIEYGINRKVITYDNGFQAWQHLQNQPQSVDIIIADANLPEISGFDVLQRVKNHMPEVPFIMVAGDATLEETARQLGADAFIFKPFDAEDLFAVINQFVLAPPSQPAAKVTQLKETSHGNGADDA